MLQNRSKTAKIMTKRPDFMKDRWEKDVVNQSNAKRYGTKFLKNYQTKLLSKSGENIPIRNIFFALWKKSLNTDLMQNFAKNRPSFMFENNLKVLIPANSYFLLANREKTWKDLSLRPMVILFLANKGLIMTIIQTF